MPYRGGVFPVSVAPSATPGVLCRSRLLQPSRDLLAGFPLYVKRIRTYVRVERLPRVTVYLGRRRVPIAANTASRDYGKLYRIKGELATRAATPLYK
jgi:hypothetical protein